MSYYKKMVKDVRRIVNQYEEINSIYDLDLYDLDYLIGRYTYIDELGDTIREAIKMRG